MSLSFDKLLTLLNKSHLSPTTYFTDQDLRCMYIILQTNEILSFLLYIPSKYTITVPSDKHPHIINQVEEETPVDNHTEKTSPSIEKITLTDKISINPIKLLTHEVSKTNEDYLSRISYAFSDIPYKLSIFEGNYTCILNRSNDPITYTTTDYTIDGCKMYIVTNLELLIDRPNMIKEIYKVRKSIYAMFSKNYKEHLHSLDNLLRFKSMEFHTITTNIKNIDGYIIKFENLLALCSEKLSTLTSRQTTLGITNVGSDDVSLHNKYKSSLLLKEIEALKNNKRKIISYINELITHKDKLLLTTSKIFLRNEHHLIEMNENYVKLKELLDLKTL